MDKETRDFFIGTFNGVIFSVAIVFIVVAIVWFCK